MTTPLIYCHTNQCDKNMKEISGGIDPRKKRTAKGCPVSTHIPIEMDEDENEQENKKNVEFVDNKVITEIIVLTYLHLKFFLNQM